MGFVSFQVNDIKVLILAIVARIKHLLWVYDAKVNDEIFSCLFDYFEDISIRVDVNKFVSVFLHVEKLSQNDKSIIIGPSEERKVFDGGLEVYFYLFLMKHISDIKFIN